MSTIGGKKREQLAEVSKKVGLFEANVIAINPGAEFYKEVLGTDLKEDSKATEYLGVSKDGNTTLRVDIWLEEVKKKDKFKVTFFLENKVRKSKDDVKTQYINAVGSCSWSDDPNSLPDWFTSREYRPAFMGEEELYNFLRTWLGKLDYRDAETVLEIEWKKLMKGNVKDIAEQIDGEFCTPVVALATIKTVTKAVTGDDGSTTEEVKEYQSIFNKAFLPSYSIKQFRLVDYTKSQTIEMLKAKKPKDLKPHERFALTVTGEYGCKDFFILKDLKEYDPNDNLVATDKAITTDGDDY